MAYWVCSPSRYKNYSSGAVLRENLLQQIDFLSGTEVVLAKTKWHPACWSLLADAGAKARRSASFGERM
jgi:hypothetical protein